MTFRFISLALALVLAGCALFGPKITREMRRTPEYRDGYVIRGLKSLHVEF